MSWGDKVRRDWDLRSNRDRVKRGKIQIVDFSPKKTFRYEESFHTRLNRTKIDERRKDD